MLIKKLLEKLKKNRDTKKWWINTYLPTKNYFTVNNQLDRNTALQDYTEKAIKKYLSE